MECLKLVIVLLVMSEARELRPSDHGLQYTPSPAGNASEAPAKSFFSGGGEVALPKAMNSSSSDSSSDDMSWLGNSKEAREHKRRGHVLLLVSLVCGITGVLLSLTSAFVYVFRHRKRKPEEAS